MNRGNLHGALADHASHVSIRNHKRFTLSRQTKAHINQLSKLLTLDLLTNLKKNRELMIESEPVSS